MFNFVKMDLKLIFKSKMIYITLFIYSILTVISNYIITRPIAFGARNILTKEFNSIKTIFAGTIDGSISIFVMLVLLSIVNRQNKSGVNKTLARGKIYRTDLLISKVLSTSIIAFIFMFFCIVINFLSIYRFYGEIIYNFDISVLASIFVSLAYHIAVVNLAIMLYFLFKSYSFSIVSILFIIPLFNIAYRYVDSNGYLPFKLQEISLISNKFVQEIARGINMSSNYNYKILLISIVYASLSFIISNYLFINRDI